MLANYILFNAYPLESEWWAIRCNVPSRVRRGEKSGSVGSSLIAEKGCGGVDDAVADPLFGPSEVTPTIAMGVVGSSAVEHAATASATDAYSSLVKDLVLLARCKKPFWEMNLRLRCVISARYSCAF
ncbi:Protein of unknown function [Gryllus bimaculatus]|nr:Protein of unknown function [Gryllus bimaculatus]